MPIHQAHLLPFAIREPRKQINPPNKKVESVSKSAEGPIHQNSENTKVIKSPNPINIIPIPIVFIHQAAIFVFIGSETFSI